MMLDWQQDVITEKAALDARLATMRAFIGDYGFWKLPLPERGLLMRQEQAMTRYSELLGKRIARFGMEARGNANDAA